MRSQLNWTWITGHTIMEPKFDMDVRPSEFIHGLCLYLLHFTIGGNCSCTSYHASNRWFDQLDIVIGCTVMEPKLLWMEAMDWSSGQTSEICILMISKKSKGLHFFLIFKQLTMAQKESFLFHYINKISLDYSLTLYFKNFTITMGKYVKLLVTTKPHTKHLV